MYYFTLTGFSYSKKYIIPICKYPYVVVSPLNIDLSLIHMNKWTFQRRVLAGVTEKF